MKEIVINILTSLQQNTLVLAAMSFTFLCLSMTTFELSIGSAKIPNNLIYYCSIAIVSLLYWNIYRMTSKLSKLFSHHNNSKESMRILLTNNSWVIDPFGDLGTSKLRLRNILPTSILLANAAIFGLTSMKIFNQTDSIVLMSNVVSRYIMVPLVYFLSSIPFIISLCFFNKVLNMLKYFDYKTNVFFIWVGIFALVICYLFDLLSPLLLFV